MKIFIFFTLFIFLIYLLGFIKRSEIASWMNRDFTTAVKGFSILTVVWAHSGHRLGVGMIQFVAGAGVSLFIICSGYGLESSYQKSGLNKYWLKKLVKVCIPFWGIELIGFFVTNTFTVKKYLLDACFIEPGTSYSWYMQYIVICYVIFFIVKKLSEKYESIRNYETPLLLGIFAVWFVIVSLFFANPDFPFLQARQMLSFPCGVLIAKYKDKIIGKLSKSKKNNLILAGGYSNWLSHDACYTAECY